MAIKRITISVPAAVAGRIKKAAGAAPVSAWITDVIEERLNDAELEKQWQAFYRNVSPAKADVARAQGLFKRLAKGRANKGAA